MNIKSLIGKDFAGVVSLVQNGDVVLLELGSARHHYHSGRKIQRIFFKKDTKKSF